VVSFSKPFEACVCWGKEDFNKTPSSKESSSLKKKNYKVLSLIPKTGKE
jgi:hypothetical protein